MERIGCVAMGTAVRSVDSLNPCSWDELDSIRNDDVKYRLGAEDEE